ncbi:WD40/YVTN/BNR-like repeat-containing protein [Winogradskyella endarachnes]|uniref:Oxidoreductase n=1 Tax=Winogradskyella endarachnes TaxID=2681965 RepID=A0A6L6UBC2_9FLAO|nr:oxidoreductase [Winogradskyella endarachnes]MUU78232.1 oxidoreductase [Winogradskyella endarachnes]
MKKIVLIITLIIVYASSCSLRKNNNNGHDFHSKNKTVSIETLIQDSTLNVRALEIDDNGVGSFALSNGKIGGVSKNNNGNYSAGLSFQIKHDTVLPNFRALALTESSGFVISIGAPTLLYKVSDSLKLVYQENHKKAFYDSMDFWNDKEGIAIGDPTEDCMSIIITRDGGDTWEKLSCNDLPKAKEGEAAFAASDTNIAIIGDHTWVATGGRASRILYSPDKGKTWDVYNTPIFQGKETTGIYSIDFYDENNGFAIGGDYTKPNDTLNNKIRTNDGGKTWQVVANGKGPGYRSCVQYIPNSDGKELVVIGFKGIDYSNNAGESWQHLSDEGFYTIRFVNDTVAYAAGKGRISKLTFRE